MKLVVAKVDHIYFDGEAVSLTAPGSEGQLTILGKHEPLITLLKKGTIVVKETTGEQKIDIEGGVLEVNAQGATVIL